MTTRYASFLVRCWRSGSGTERILVEHVQSGEQAVVRTLDAAATWISAQAHDGPPDPGSTRSSDAGRSPPDRTTNDPR